MRAPSDRIRGLTLLVVMMASLCVAACNSPRPSAKTDPELKAKFAALQHARDTGAISVQDYDRQVSDVIRAQTAGASQPQR